jgi:hypothetical protein
MMVAVLSVALLLGPIGLAVHVLWTVGIIVIALGLGFAAANRRRDRLDVVNKRADRQDEQSAASPTEDSGPTRISPGKPPPSAVPSICVQIRLASSAHRPAVQGGGSASR